MFYTYTQNSDFGFGYFPGAPKYFIVQGNDKKDIYDRAEPYLQLYGQEGFYCELCNDIHERFNQCYNDYDLDKHPKINDKYLIDFFENNTIGFETGDILHLLLDDGRLIKWKTGQDFLDEYESLI